MDDSEKHGIIKLPENEKRETILNVFYVSVYCCSLRGDSYGETE